jgi:TRAP transporter TAXI family solute receptor
MGIATGDMVYKSTNGLAPFKKKLPDVKVLFAGLQPGAVQATVLEKSKINSFFDLKGVRVGVGPISGPGQVVEDLIYAAGITKGSFTPSYLGFSQAVQQLADRNLDCAIAMSGAPVAAIKELGAMNKYRMLSVEDQIAQKFLAKYPFYFRFEIAKEIYGLGYPVRTVAGYNTVIVTAKMSDDLAHKIIKGVFDNLEEFKKSHPSLNYLSLKTGAEAAGSLPYHPGAAKFFKEKGINIKAN